MSIDLVSFIICGSTTLGWATKESQPRRSLWVKK